MRTQSVLLAVAALLVTTVASAQFYEGFDGSFENPWNTFPFADKNLGDIPFAFFEGAPIGSFGTLDGASVFRMTNTMASLEYVGMSPALYLMDGTEEIVEARINTMGVAFTPVDGLFVFRVISPGGESITFGLYALDHGVTRRVLAKSNITGLFNFFPANYHDNTWYRLRLDNTGAELKGQLLSDDGYLVQEVSFGHKLDDLIVSGPGLYLAVIQAAFTPATPITADVSVDFVKVVPGCPADFVAPHGVLDLGDVNAFVTLFTAVNTGADLNGDGVIDLGDISIFITSFNAGCP